MQREPGSPGEGDQRVLNKYQKKSAFREERGGSLRECHCHHPGRGSRSAAPRTAPSVYSAAHQCAPRRRPATLAASHRSSSSTLEDRKVPSERYFHALLTGEKIPRKMFSRDSQEACVSRALRGGRGKEEPLSAIAMVLQAAPGDDGLPPPGPPRHTSAAQCLTTRTREASPCAGYPAHGSACQPRIHASVVRAHGIQAFARQRRG